jgi:hypothetical protein
MKDAFMQTSGCSHLPASAGSSGVEPAQAAGAAVIYLGGKGLLSAASGVLPVTLVSH